MHILVHIGKGLNTRKPDFGACEQQGAGPYPSAKSDQRLYCSLMESIITELASCKISFYPWSLKMNRTEQNRTEVYLKIPKGINATRIYKHNITQCTNMAVDGVVIKCSRI